MDKEQFELLSDKDAQLKTDKDIIEIQKTMIYYGNKIIEDIDKINTLIKMMIAQRDRGKDVIVFPSEKPKEELSTNPMVRHLQRMEIPKGYKGNDKL